MKTIETLFWSLLMIPSVSGTEKNIADYIVMLLSKENFNIQKIPVTKNTYCIKATIGIPQVYLSAHMDTVPYGPKPKETAYFFKGRGSCDTKASIASMIMGALAVKKKGGKNIGLLFTVEEETSFAGAKKILKTLSPLPFIVIGEPTSLAMVTSQFGFLEIEISAQGKAAHTSNPTKGINAIEALLTWEKKVKPLITYSKTVSTLCKISGGIAGNIIPEKASMTISFRTDPNDPTDYIDKLKKQTRQKNITIQNTCNVPAIKTIIPDQLSWIKNRTSVMYASELSIFKNGIILGPGDITYAHSENEYICKKELRKAVHMYEQIITSFQV